MKFRTEIIIPPSEFSISYQDKIIMMGSCFVENISIKILQAGFTTIVNPFGIVFNPTSVANSLFDLIKNTIYTKENLFLYEGNYHSFLHHSRFSGTDNEQVLNKINTNIIDASLFLRQANTLIVTFGTAKIFRLLSSGKVVSNCHKLPAKLFQEECLSIDQIVLQWNKLIQELHTVNPNLRILFTISPIRHNKGGNDANGNQLSKATLLLAVNDLIQTNTLCYYFPSYEIMLDDLRDYRFYAEDMIHPNIQAINYIWEKFCNTYFDKKTKEFIKKQECIAKISNHRPMTV